MQIKTVVKAFLPIILLIAMASEDGYGQSHPPIAVPDGFATLNGGTTGGGEAKPVIVTTADEFKKLVADDTPHVIVVQGRIDLGGPIGVGSNKTIIGADYSSGIYGGTVRVRGKNYIFQNLIIGPAKGDAMEVSGGSNVFVHKCDFIDSTDESLSIVRDSDFVTVSWCKFYFTKTHSHAFGHLIGGRTDRTSDRGKLNVTMHHNWYCEGVRSRAPRVRYGHVHLYNNYYNVPDNNYCIGVGHESNIRLENTHFEGIKSPWKYMDKPGSGTLGWNGLKFVNSSEPTAVPNAYSTIFTPPYKYKPDDAGDIAKMLTDPVYGAGNRQTQSSPK
jgi:pectate lyase